MRRWIVVLFGLVTGFACTDAAAREGGMAAHVPLRGRLDEFLVESFHRRLGEAKRLTPPPGKEKEAPAPRSADLIIFELQTTPGPLASALSVADAIHKLRDQGIETVALVAAPGSASDALLALACDRLFMASGAALGPLDPAAFQPAPGPDAQKALRDALARYSAWRTRLQPLYEAFVEPATEVYAVVFEGAERTPKFALADEYKRLVASPPSPILRSERVAKAGEAVKLAAADAERIGLSGGTAASADAVAAQVGVSLPSLVSLKQGGESPAPKAPAEKRAPEPQAPRQWGKPRTRPAEGDKVVFIPLDGMVGEGMLYSVRRRLATARGMNPALVVFEMNTLGGALHPALKIGDLIFGTTSFPTVAWVNREAISAGALISVSCSEIVMQESSVLGDSAVVDGSSGEMLRSEKIDSYLRARFLNFCEGKYPGALVEAMVTVGTEVYEVETLDGKYEYFTANEYQNLLRSPDQLARYKDPRNPKKVLESGKLLTMNEKQGKHFGFSSATVRSRGELLDFYGLAGCQTVTLEWTWSERLVRWLDLVGPFLLSLGILGILIELKTQGSTSGVFALIGLAFIAIFFLGKYAAGLAEVWEIVLFFVGLTLLAVEVFVTPGFGLLGISGIVLMAVSVLLSFQGFTIPHTTGQWVDFRWSIVQLGLAALGVFVGAVLIGRYLHRAPYLGKMILAEPPPSTAPTAVTEGVSPLPSAQEEEQRATRLVGRRGKAVSMLRPAGRADFDGEPLDVVTEGDFIAPGEPVVVAAVHGNRIVVRKTT